MVSMPLVVTTSREGTFEGFFEAHYEHLLRVMYLVTGERHEAEDLAQEAFVRLYERWERVRGLSDPVGYLFRTALNAHRSRLRRIAVAARRIVARQEPDPIAATDDRDAIRRALSGLPVAQRQALVLVGWFRMTDSEAATILGVTPVAVRVRISRARERLRREMRGDDDE